MPPQRPSQADVITEAMPLQRPSQADVITEAMPLQKPSQADVITQAMPLQSPSQSDIITEALPLQRPSQSDIITEALPLNQSQADVITEAMPLNRPHREAAAQAVPPAQAAGNSGAPKASSSAEAVKVRDDKAAANQKMSMSQIIKAKTRKIPTDKIDQLYDDKNVKPEEQRHWLKPYQRELFEGYLGIRNMERQISYAIDQALAKGADRTSRTGNVLIFGGHGCGKSTIATGLAKAITQERGKQTVKMAKIYATDLNRKDIAATIAKIAGGILIIEEAGDLEDATADQLTTAMEFRTDGLIIMMEDEQKYLHELLMRHPRLTMKFTSQIYIPVFSMEELIGFGNIYATDQGYAFSEGSVTALAGKLSAIAEQGEAISISNVLDQVDLAIKRANTFGRRMFGGKKRFDENGRIILQDKDFR